MKRILITGMSGTGKSAVVEELAVRGYRAIDLDKPEWSHWVDADPSDQFTPAKGKDWIWREDRVRALLSESIEGSLFISGCAENMSRLLPLIDLVILLSAPADIIMERLQRRTIDGYGHAEEQRKKVAHLMSTIEPLLRRRADREIDTRQPVQTTADKILEISSEMKE